MNDSLNLSEVTAHARRGRWTTRKVLALMLGTILTTSLVSSVGVVWASHQFNDVPDSHPFHDDIAWLADNDITEGFPDGGFHPSAAVTRQAVAAFLHRYNGEIEVVQNSVNPGSASAFNASANCPVGKQAIAGGGFISSTDAFITDSRPTDIDTWGVRWETEDEAAIDPVNIDVYVTCIPLQ